MDVLLPYLSLIFPGICLAGVALTLLPKSQTALRLTVLILAFILLRDALVPAGLWQITTSLEMRFAPSSFVICVLAFASLGLAFFVQKVIDVPRPILLKTKSSKSILLGFLGGILVFIPVLVLNRAGFASSSLPKPSGPTLLTSLLLVCLFGNFLEEVLFRGYLQELAARSGLSRNRAAVFSAVMFSFCHVFLAFTVTKVGVPILVFTLYEGLICAFLAAQYGLLAATMAHGFGIFWISSAIFL